MTTFREGFLSQVARRPGAPALVWHGQVTTYGELYELADKARARLEWLDLAPGEPVGLLAKKSPDAVALVLGAFLSGRRFLLPSPALSNSALTSLFAQAACRHVVVPEGVEEFVPDIDGTAADTAALEATEVDGVHFMLTTSGSTGLPKIVPLPQKGVDRFVAWAGKEFDIRPGRTVLNYAPLNFDLCLLDVWTTLAHGGQVVLVDADYAANGRYLLDLVVRHEVDIIQAVPMFFGLLLDVANTGEEKLATVDRVMFTGDAIPDRTLTELPKLFPRAKLHNIYGCTETNDSFLHTLEPGETPPVSIGKPLPGVRTLVLAGDGTVLKGPGTGELYVSTPFQAAGYLDRTRHTDKFVPHPTGLDNRPWFRSGDLVRREADGRVFLIGRSDFQVKVRGVAINTAEVEHVLQEHPAVLEAAVVAVPDPIAGRKLIAGVQRAPDSKLNSLTLRQHCARRLPQAAIPSTLHIVDEPLPKTSTGKVDRNAAVDWFSRVSAKR